MSEEVIIRDGQIKDKENTLAVWEELTEYSIDISTYDFDMVKEAPELWMKYFETNVRSRNRKAIVAEQDGKIIGYLLGYIQKRPPIFKTSHQAHITDIAVISSKRNKGVGTKLLDAFSNWAREKKMKYVTLGVLPENKSGIKFYQKQGFNTILLKQRKILRED